MPTEGDFGSIALPENLQKKVQVLCEDLKLTSTDLFFKWEAWALAHKNTSDVPTRTDLDQLAAHIREKAAAAAARSASTPTPRSKRKSTSSPVFTPLPTPTSINIDDFFNYVDPTILPPSPKPEPEQEVGDTKEEPIIDVIIEDEPPSPLPQPRFETPPRDIKPPLDDITLPADDAPDNAYARRAGSGRIEAAHVPTAAQTERPRTSMTYKIRRAIPSDARYMNDELSGRIEALRARVSAMGTSILRRVAVVKGLDDVPECSPDAFFVASPSVMFAVGRVRVELDETDGVGAGRINANSVLLESVDGNLVKLDLARLVEEKRPLFLSPGMIVVIEGVNTNGRQIDVHAIYDNCVEVQEGSQTQGEQESEDCFVNVIAASGPLTTSSNLKYEPLDDLLQVIERSKPDAVFLTGPFVDGRHSLISETLSVTFETIFETRVLSRIVTCARKLRNAGHACTFFLIPSLDDVHHEFVCPQPAFRWVDGMDSDGCVVFVTNPCVVDLQSEDGARTVSLGTSSLPAVMDISSDSICVNQDRFQAIASQMVKQRSFYPTFPPSASVPLDSTLMAGLNLPQSDSSGSVDCLIVPSRMKAFAKCAEAGAVVINPGLLCRGAGGGTYAEISLPLHRDDVPRPNDFNEVRSQVNVVRL